MSGINKVVLIGRLGKDPESKQTRDGKEFSKFSIATSRKTKEKEITQWHNITVWNESTAKYVNAFAVKGTLIYVEGEIEYRQYENKDGVTVNATDIIVYAYGGNVQILKDGAGRDEGGRAQSTTKKRQTYGEASGREDPPSGMHDDIGDDEIPF